MRLISSSIAMSHLVISLPLSVEPAVSLSVTFTEEVITDIVYSQTNFKPIIAKQHYSDFANKIKNEINNYFARSSSQFTLKCAIQQGTKFQQRVWQALLDIPVGQVKTYGLLAKELNSSPRAIGNACRNNRFPIIIPCHRVVSAQGLGGYSGDTLLNQQGSIHYMQIKQCLLAHEQASIL